MFTRKDIFIKGIVDAKIDLKRHVIISKKAKEYGFEVMNPTLGAGDQSYHLHEWNFFYNNIKENGLKRIKAFLSLNDINLAVNKMKD